MTGGWCKKMTMSMRYRPDAMTVVSFTLPEQGRREATRAEAEPLDMETWVLLQGKPWEGGEMRA